MSRRNKSDWTPGAEKEPYHAPGIRNKRRYGDLSELSPGDLLTYVIQHHSAKKAGPHYDMRAGTPESDLYSWVTRKGVPEPGKSVGVFRQPLHDYDYKDFQGMIPPGYGHGMVRKVQEGKLLVTKKEGNKNIHFTVADKQNPKRMVLTHPGGRDWKHALLTRAKNMPSSDVEKPGFKSLEPDEIKEYLRNLGPEDETQAKIDGALALVQLLKNKDIEVLSHRKSKRTGDNIVHTERFFGKRPKADVPKDLKNSTLMGEMYGTQDDKVIPPQQLGGILNSAIGKSLEGQKEKDVLLKIMLFDIARRQGKAVDLPYDERMKLLEQAAKALPKDKFHLPERAKGPEEGMELYKRIAKHKHPLSSEGVVIRREGEDKPIKGKLTKEYDVYIKKILRGEGKYRNAAGAFEYSLTPDGKVVGRVGTGLDDATRKLLMENPADFIDRVARIKSQGQFKDTGAYRAPVLISLHESK